MDITTIFGLVLGFAGLIVGFFMEGGSLNMIWGVSPLLIVVGGTFGATIISYRWADIKQVPTLLADAFLERGKINLEAEIQKLVEFSTLARREGLLALEEEVEGLEENDAFLKKGILFAIDGTESELLKEIMELELYNQERAEERGAKIFESAGGYAPTMGIIGTVMGLVLVLSDLSDPEQLGHSIAVAFIATLYGVMSANLIYLPIGNKLKQNSQAKSLHREMIIEGVLSIQSGENPKVMEQKLRAFLPNPLKKKKKETQAGAGRTVGEEVTE